MEVLGGVIVVVAIFAPMIAPMNPQAQDIWERYAAPRGLIIDGSLNTTYILGADELGRDVLSRLIMGTRVSLLVAGIATGISLAGGLFLGAIAGYVGGRIDNLIMRVMDGFMAFPGVLLAIAVSRRVTFKRPELLYGVLAASLVVESLRHGWRTVEADARLHLGTLGQLLDEPTDDVLREFDEALAIFDEVDDDPVLGQDHPLGRHAGRHGQVSVGHQVTPLPVDGHHVARTDDVVAVQELPRAGVTGHVHQGIALVHHVGSEAGQPVDDAVHGVLVAGDHR